FGSKSIVERFKLEGVPIREVIAIGGVAKKSPFVMQTLSDVLNMPIKVAVSEQACALGAAMFAAVASGIYDSLPEAQKAMSSGFDAVYEPRPDIVPIYESLYRKYLEAGDFLENTFLKEEISTL